MAAFKLPPGQYKLTLKSYMPEVPGQFPATLDAGTTVLYDGIPGEHMTPLDQQAHENCAWRDRRKQPAAKPMSADIPRQIKGRPVPVNQALDDMLDDGAEAPEPTAPEPPPAEKPKGRPGRPRGKNYRGKR